MAVAKKQKFVDKARPAAHTILIVTGIVILLSALAIVFFFSHYIMWPGTSKSLEQYLDNKYKDTFIVENVHRGSQDFGAPVYTSADAYPTNNPQIKFKISKSPANEYTDTYLKVLWTSQEHAKIEQDIKTLEPSGRHYTINVTISPQASLIERVSGTPSYTEGKKLSVKEISLTIQLEDQVTYSDSQQQEYAQFIYKIVQLYGRNPALETSIYYSGYGAATKGKNENTKIEPGYICDLSPDDIAEIKTSSDIAKCFRQYLGRKV